MTFDVNQFDIEKFDSILARGLSNGLGERGGQVCIEAAICETLGIEHGDDPKCVVESVRRFKIRLNDSKWSSAKARAEGLRDLGIAQLGSLGVVDDREFSRKLSEKVIRVLIPDLFRAVFAGKPDALEAADRCERGGTKEAALAARDVARKYYAAAAAAAYAAAYAAAAYAAYTYDAAAAAAAAYAKKPKDYYLKMVANLALETLRELKSPGIELL